MLTIKDIQLQEELQQYSYKGPDKSDPAIISKLSKINLFVGSNNSGKSRLIRGISARKALVFSPNISFDELNSIITAFQQGLAQIIQGPVQEVAGYKEKASKITTLSLIQEGVDFTQSIRDIIAQAANQSTNGMSIAGHSQDFDGIRQRLNTLGKNLLPRIEKLSPDFGKSIHYDKYYIPSIRTLRTLDIDNGNDILETITRDSYFEKGDCPKIFTGLKMKTEVENMRLGDRKQRRALEEFETYLSQSFFGNQDVELSVRKDSRPLYIKIGEEEEYPIFNLGDGIQMVIILTFLLFRFRDVPKLLFIEEPELFLHPGMQRMVIEQFLAAENVQFFIATHSNHLLDMTLDSNNISIYTVRKQLHKGTSDVHDAKFDIENVSHGNRQTLDLLGSKNSSIFLTNCTVWVEGITDRRYLSHYLQLYILHRQSDISDAKETLFEPKEDLHFSFMEYSGANITHWSFLNESPDAILVDRLCGRLFLITDQDNATGKKGERLDKLNAILKERYYCLEAREIENLLSPEIIRMVIGDYEGDTNKLNPFTYDQYKKEHLGQFIENKILSVKKRKGSYQSESGSINDKLAFCEKALKHITVYESLSEEAKALTKKLFDFIKSNNV